VAVVLLGAAVIAVPSFFNLALAASHSAKPRCRAGYVAKRVTVAKRVRKHGRWIMVRKHGKVVRVRVWNCERKATQQPAPVTTTAPVASTTTTTTTPTTTTTTTTPTTTTTTTTTTPPAPTTIAVYCSTQNPEPSDYYTECNATLEAGGYPVTGSSGEPADWTVEDETLGEACTIPWDLGSESFEIINGHLSPGYVTSLTGMTGSLCRASNVSPDDTFELQVTTGELQLDGSSYAGASSNWLGLTLYNG
jgi:hypothetical protein